MNWKDMLKIFLGALLPALFTQLVSHYPDFPLFAEDFTAIILWIVGLLVGGWGLNAMYVKTCLKKARNDSDVRTRLKKAGYDYEALVSK